MKIDVTGLAKAWLKLYQIIPLTATVLTVQSMQEFSVLSTQCDEFKIPKEQIMACATIKNLLNDLEDIEKLTKAEKKQEEKTSIPLPLLSSPEILLLKRFLHVVHLLEQNNISEVQRNKLLQEFHDIDTSSKLFTLLQAANYLQAKKLLKRCLKIWAFKKYIPTSSTHLTSHLEARITRRMERTQRLLFHVPLSVATDLIRQETPLLKKRLTPLQGSVWSNALNENSTMLASGHNTGILSIYDLEGDHYQYIDTANGGVSMVQWGSEDLLWSSGKDKCIKLWDITTQRLIANYQSPLTKAFVFRYIPKHNLLVSDGKNFTLCFWDLLKGAHEPVVVPAHTDRILALESSRNGLFFATGSCDGTAHIWDAHSRQNCQTFYYAQGVNSLNFSYDENYLACGLKNGRIILQDLTTEKTIFDKKGHGTGIWSVIFADKQNTLLCSGGQDNFIRLWDIRTGNPIFILYDHTEEIQYMAMDTTGELLYSASHDHTINVWDLKKITHPIRTLRHEFTYHTTIEQIRLLEDADASEKPLNVQIPIRKKIFERFSPQAQEFLLNHENIIKKRLVTFPK